MCIRDRDDDEGTCTHASMLLKKMGIDAEWVQHGSIAVQMALKAHENSCDYLSLIHI